ncbi:uncharacterized protein LTR77_005584 [Saxophila tyrrhenica]|uniref:NADAR domain-containing protein n=1 Tax=Saxophila tyrrhenica TaxID=1690608 RepID=A0AAV9PCY1_9PEZI|nr:hypothetical protein LTR77_005584 [Saxophila tyrrhenica]
MPKQNDKKAAKTHQEPTPRKPKHKKSDTSGAPSDHHGVPVFFWKEDEENGFLCQWYRCSFTEPEHEGLILNCAEQYMMWRKAMLFDDPATAAKIMAITSARKQKGLGREIQNYDEAKWCEARLEIVQRGNWLKFTQSTDVASMKMDDVGEPVPLKDLLLATKDQELAEASPFDTVWGIGSKAEEALKVSRSRWGENLLGKALMHVRSEMTKLSKE